MLYPPENFDKIFYLFPVLPKSPWRNTGFGMNSIDNAGLFWFAVFTTSEDLMTKTDMNIADFLICLLFKINSKFL